MQTRLLFFDSGQNLEYIMKKFTKKYGDIEALLREVQRDRCTIPEKVDDFMVWQSITASEKEESSQDGAPTARPVPGIVFKETIIINSFDFYQVFTPRRMELLDYTHKNKPTSVKTLAAETDRDYKNVYDDLLAMERVGLLEFVREGKNKRPVSRLTGLEIVFRK